MWTDGINTRRDVVALVKQNISFGENVSLIHWRKSPKNILKGLDGYEGMLLLHDGSERSPKKSSIHYPLCNY